MLKFEEKVFYEEYALSLYQLTQIILLYLIENSIHSFQKWLLFGGFATIFIHKQSREGLRVNSFLLLLNEILILLRQTQLVPIPYIILVITLGFYILSIKRLKVYIFPKPRGSYNVGYIHRIEKKLFQNSQKNLQFSVYYPCVFDSSKTDTNWMIADNYWSRMHDTTMKDKERPGKVPKFFFRFQSQYLNKIQMGVLKNASLIPIEELFYKSPFDRSTKSEDKVVINLSETDRMLNKSIEIDSDCDDDSKKQPEQAIKMDKFPVVIISHGLAAHCNAYTLFAKEFASKGYIVFSMEHDEEIKNPYFDREQNWEFRYDQLMDRLETSKKMLDIIYNQNYMRKLFGFKQNSEIPLDYDKISILGHSFGGSTSLYTAMNDERITGVVVGLDPCVYAFKKEEISSCKFPRPLLCINSEDFYRRLYPWFENDQSLEIMFNNMKEYKDISINCAVKGSAHANQSDLAIVMAGEFELYGITQRGECAKKHMFFNLMLFEYYFDRYLIKNERKLKKEQFLKDYFNIIDEEYQKAYIFPQNESIHES